MDLLHRLEARVDALENRVKFCLKYANYLQYSEEFEGKFILPVQKRLSQWK
jgi:hypothetical protein